LRWQSLGHPLNLFSRVQFNGAGFKFFAVSAFSNPVKYRIAFSKTADTISEINPDVVLAEVQILTALPAKEACKVGACEKSIDVGIFTVVCRVADERIIENQMDISGLPPHLTATDCLLNPETHRGARNPALACLADLVATDISVMKKYSVAVSQFVVVDDEPELLVS
jgi:hypothetical protein